MHVPSFEEEPEESDEDDMNNHKTRTCLADNLILIWWVKKWTAIYWQKIAPLLKEKMKVSGGPARGALTLLTVMAVLLLSLMQAGEVGGQAGADVDMGAEQDTDPRSGH